MMRPNFMSGSEADKAAVEFITNQILEMTNGKALDLYRDEACALYDALTAKLSDQTSDPAEVGERFALIYLAMSKQMVRLSEIMTGMFNEIQQLRTHRDNLVRELSKITTFEKVEVLPSSEYLFVDKERIARYVRGRADRAVFAAIANDGGYMKYEETEFDQEDAITALRISSKLSVYPGTHDDIRSAIAGGHSDVPVEGVGGADIRNAIEGADAKA